MNKNKKSKNIYGILSIAVAMLLILNIFSGFSFIGYGKQAEVEISDSHKNSPKILETKNLTRDEGVVVSAQDVPALIGTPVDSNDVKNPDNDILVYVWSNTSKDWHQIPFQVDERNASTGSYGVNNSNGVLDGIDEIVFMSGDAGDRAPRNAWVVGCDAPRYEIKVVDPLTGEDAWAYICKSSTVEANFIGDYSSFDKDHNDITAQSYEMGFHDGVGMIVDEFRILPSAGGDGTDLTDLLQMEIDVSAGGGLVSKQLDEDDISSDFKLKKDGYVRSLGVVSMEEHYHKNGVDADVYFNFTWFFYPDYINASGYLNMNVSGANVDEIWMGLDHSPDACPMDYRDSLGNTAIVDGNDSNDNISSDDLERWWEMKGSHGGYVCLWNLQDFKASYKYLKFDDNSSANESSHAWADQNGHYGLTGSDFQTVDSVQKSWANISVYPLASNVSGKAENELQNETHPLQVNATEQHSPAVWVKKTASPVAVDRGDAVQYVVYFNNTGDRTAGHVWINDTLPADVIYDNASSSEGTKTGDYNWTFSNVTPGVHYFVINCTVADTAIPGEIITNNVYCDFNNSADMMPRSYASANIRVKSPHIEVVKTADKEICSPGDSLAYTIYFNNTGETKAETVWINDTLPSYVQYLNDNSSQIGGSRNDTNYVFHNVSVGNHWFIMNVTVTDGPDNSSVSNYVHLDYTAPGGYKMNSSEDWANFTLIKPVIDLCSLSNISSAEAGEHAAYIIYFNNTGNASAPKVWMNVTLPDAVSYVSDSNSTEGGSKTGDYNWTFSNIAAYSSHSFQINVTLNGGVLDGSMERADINVDYSTSGGYIYSNSSNASFYAKAPSIVVDKIVNATGISNDSTPGALLQYTIYFNNTGSTNASYVWINDTLPSTVKYLNDSNSTEGGAYLGNYHWLFRNVTVGTHYFVINVSVDQSLSDGDKIINNVTLEYKDGTNTSMPSSDSNATTIVSSKPIITDTTTGIPTTGDDYNITCDVTSNEGISEVHLYYWFNTTSGSTTPSNVSMNSAGGDSYYFVLNVPSNAQALHYNISAVDTDGRWSETGQTDKAVSDNDPPSLSDTTSGKISAGADYNISANVSDNIGIAGVYLNYTITCSNGTNETGNVSMNGSAPSYWYVLSIGENATWLNYTIWAEDTNVTANWNSSSNEIHIDSEPPEISDRTSGMPTTGDSFKVSADITDDSGNVAEADVEYWFGTGPHSNETMTNTGGNTWEYTITIPSDSTNSLHYILHARDLSYNWNETSEKTLDVKDNDAPAITDNSPSTATTGDPYTFSADVTDNIEVGEVDVEYWFGTGTHSNETMTNTGGNTWEYTITIPSDSTNSLHYIFHASDTSNNWNSTPQELVSVSDNDPPEIADSTPGNPNTGQSFTILASVTDNIGIASVSLEYHFLLANGTETSTDNISMNLQKGYFSAEINIPDSSVHLYYTISASDSSGNWASLDESLDVNDTEAPVIGEPSGNLTTGDSSAISVIVEDNCMSVHSVWMSYWFESTTGDTDPQNVSFMGSSYPNYGCTIQAPVNATLMHYTIYASDTNGNTGNRSGTLDVVDNDNPYASISIESRGGYTVGDTIILNASQSTDNIRISNYTWYINGSTTTVLYGLEISYTFQSAGNYTITLIVRDNAGNRDVRTMPETVRAPQTGTPEKAPEGSNDWWWLLPLILILLLLFALLAWKRRKKEPEEELQEDSTESSEVDTEGKSEESQSEEESENLEYQEDEETS